MSFNQPFNETKPWESQDTDILTKDSDAWQLIVWNDEVNTFEWVIETLIEV
ncbi:MAG TPA: Clp protease ClpS, partial [Chitinophagaceae bacterium]|nr:Clp protease ClpS [Chitinophagaceae bacterium]